MTAIMRLLFLSFCLVTASASRLMAGGSSAPSIPPPPTPVAIVPCAQSVNNVFRPECYVATGSGNTLVSQADAAFNAAAAYVTANGGGAVVELGDEIYPVCNNQLGWIMPQSSSYGGSVSIKGKNSLTSILSLMCQINRVSLPSGAQSGQTILQDVIWFPVYTTAVLTNFTWANFAVYANGVANSVFDLDGLIATTVIENVVATGAVGDGTSLSHEVRFGNPSYTTTQSWFFQSFIRNLDVGGVGTTGNGATFTASISSGTLSATVNTGGTGYTANTRPYVNICATTAPITATISGGVITGLSSTPSSFYGCTGTVYVYAYDPGQAIAYGVILNAVTDSSFYDLQSAIGYTAAILSSNQTGNDTFYSAHPCCGMEWEIEEIANYGNNWVSTEFDSPGQVGAYQAGTQASNFLFSRFFWKASYPGAGSYGFGTSTGTGKIIGGTCVGTQSAGGYNQFNNSFVYGTVPSGMVVTNEQSCSNSTYTNITGKTCASGASPAVCGSAPVGGVAVPTGTNPTLVVDTTAVTANSQIQLTPDQTLGTNLSVTCNTTITTQGPLVVTSRTPGTSFTIEVDATVATHPLCLNYSITN